jgi:hypothetical protein
MNLHTTEHGATQRRREDGPRQLLTKVLLKYPKSSRKRQIELFKEKVLDSKTDYLLDKIIEEWADKNLRALTRPSRVAQARKRSAQSVKGKKTRLKKLVLLSLVLPNGKTLGETTGAECVKLGPKVGRWLSTIGSRVSPTELVGKALTEKQVRTLLEEVAA